MTTNCQCESELVVLKGCEKEKMVLTALITGAAAWILTRPGVYLTRTVLGPELASMRAAVEADPRTVTVEATWSACMAQGGGPTSRTALEAALENDRLELDLDQHLRGLAQQCDEERSAGLTPIIGEYELRFEAEFHEVLNSDS